MQHEIRGLKLRGNELESVLLSEKREKDNADRMNEESSKQLQAMKIELNAVHRQLEIVSVNLS